MKKVFITFFALVTLICISCSGLQNECDGVNHNLHWVTVVEPTCTTLGSKNLICKNCEKIITTAKIDYLNHIVVVDEKQEPTCDKSGLSEGSHCDVCDSVIVKQDIINPIGHNYVLNIETSSESKLVYECNNCNDSYEEDNTTGCVNHVASSWIIVNEAKCDELGLKHKVCVNCEIELEIQSIAMTSHTVVDVLGTKATCIENGLSDGKVCSECGFIITEQTVIISTGHDYVLTNTLAPTEDEKGYYEYVCSVCDDSYKEEIEDLGSYDATNLTTIILSDEQIVVSNNNGGVTYLGSVVTICLAGEYDLVGTLSEGQIIVKLAETEKATINLKNVNITSTTADPIFIESGDKVEVSAKSGTVNYIYDKRVVDGDAVGACIYSKVDLEIKGKGELNITSTYNNGIGTTKDLEIKNLTLNVNAPNNALKGNDSITIESGYIKAISSSGDALKTENSDISDKGNQRGTITINDGYLELYAACDGIDASYDVVINGGDINVFTESYSDYSGDVTVTASETMYLRISSRSGLQGSLYKYSAKFTTEAGDVTWVNATALSGQTRYYEIAKSKDAAYVQFYCYTSSQTAGQENSYAYKSDQLTIPTSFDEYYITSVNNTTKLFVASWSNHATQSGPGGPGGMGGGMGPNDGNTNKAEYSCKGIKADNSITINGGIIDIKSHDDGIHANSDVYLQTGVYGKADITINGGEVNIYSDDDAIHADNNLTFTSGTVIISNSYEGVEGNNIHFNGATVQIKSLDDGINAKSSLYFNDGIVYLDSNGDGIDSNSQIIMTGGVVLALGPTNGGNGVIDYDRSFTISGGLLLAIGCNGMNQKPTTQSTATSTSKTISTTTNSYVTVTSNGEVVAVIKVTKNSQSYCVLAYGNNEYPSSTVNVTTTNTYNLVNGLYYVK